MYVIQFPCKPWFLSYSVSVLPFLKMLYAVLYITAVGITVNTYVYVYACMDQCLFCVHCPVAYQQDVCACLL